MLQTEKNNVFLSSWYNAVYDFMMVDSVRDDDAPLDSIPLFHFFQCFPHVYNVCNTKYRLLHHIFANKSCHNDRNVHNSYNKS